MNYYAYAYAVFALLAIGLCACFVVLDFWFLIGPLIERGWTMRKPVRKFCARITRPDGTVHSLIYFEANTRPRIVTIHGVLLIPPDYCEGKYVYAPAGWQLDLLEINK